MLDSIFQHHGLHMGVDVPYIVVSVHVFETSAKLFGNPSDSDRQF